MEALRARKRVGFIRLSCHEAGINVYPKGLLPERVSRTNPLSTTQVNWFNFPIVSSTLSSEPFRKNDTKGPSFLKLEVKSTHV